MNILQKTLGAIFPPYKFSEIRKEQRKLFDAIINALPEQLSEIKNQTKSSTFYDLTYWKLYPDFKYIVLGYGEDIIFKYKKRGENFRISGLRIFSKQTNNLENIELLIQDNLVIGLKITNSNYQLDEFKLSSIDNQNFEILSFDFPPNEIDVFYDNLDSKIKERLNYNELFDIDFNGRIFYAFYDLEDGNYLAVDKKQNVYSLIHDAKPMASRMKISFLEILEDIESKQFDVNAHFDERYRR